MTDTEIAASESGFVVCSARAPALEAHPRQQPGAGSLQTPWRLNFGDMWDPTSIMD